MIPGIEYIEDHEAVLQRQNQDRESEQLFDAAETLLNMLNQGYDVVRKSFTHWSNGQRMWLMRNRTKFPGILPNIDQFLCPSTGRVDDSFNDRYEAFMYVNFRP